jgi:hypothetical protein
MNGSRLILTAHQPVYLPWLGLLHKIALADAFVSFDDVQYQDRDWNNRNRIKTAAGPLWLTVPVFNKNHYDLKLTEVVIRNDVPWRRKHFKAIQLAYGSAPYAKRYLPYFEELYRREWERLTDLNEDILKFLLAELGIRVHFSRLSEMGLASKKSELVLEMCTRMKAVLYIFGAQGRDYADVAAFQEADVKVVFQDYVHPTYAQVHGFFVSHLSGVDLLFNHGSDALEILMSGNVSKALLEQEYLAATCA